MLTVVIPTIAGREDSYQRCIQAYRDTLAGVSYQIVTITDAPNWPSACNLGYRQAKGDVVHFTADDLEPLPGWWNQEVRDVLDADELPAPKVLNHTADGQFDNAGDGPHMAPTHFTRIPVMTRSQYDRVGPWPEIDYCADVWLSEKARLLGIQTRMVHTYAFVHHWCQIGRIDTPERVAQSERQLDELRAAYA